MAEPLGDSVSLTGDPRIDVVTQGGSWGFDGGPQVITYSFDLAPDGAVWSDAAKNAVVQALAAFSAVANVAFVEIASGGGINESTADLAFGLSSGELANQAGAVGVAGFPDLEDGDLYLEYINAVFATNYTRDTYANPEGDVLIETQYPGFFYLQPGGDGLLTILHEIGHALGLKHPFDDGGNGRPTATQLGVPQYDDGLWTIMSYDFVSPYYDIGNQATPMPLDILAIQQIYGANMTYHAGDDVYALSDDDVVRTIWDAGGVDTLDATLANGGGIVLDLRQGSVIWHGDLAATAIAYGVVIENAIGSSHDDRIVGNDAANVLEGRDGKDDLSGGQANDTLLGGAGDDRLDGGIGADYMAGGQGNDSYVVDSEADQVIELDSEGKDRIDSHVTVVLSANSFVEYVQLHGASDIDAIGSSTDNELRGNDGDNLLNGGGGDDTLWTSYGQDTLVGGTGDDLYLGFSKGYSAAIVESDDGGVDTIETTATTVLPDFVERLLLGDGFNINGTGNSLDNYIAGNPGANRLSGESGDDWLSGAYGADTLDGGTGNDTLDGFGDRDRLIGGDGNDLYFVGTPDAKPDTIIEDAGEGVDTVISFLDFTLPANFENLETLNGYLAAGNALDNEIRGNAADNLIDGRAGVDTLVGGLGNDTYVVDHAGDLVDEAGGGGDDTVRSSVDFVLGLDLENLVLYGADPIQGIGNALANSMMGNTGGNLLDGKVGADSLDGGAGTDALFGGTGDDTLNGGAGADKLVGGADDDTYVIDNVKDVIDESDGSGTDKVLSSVAFVLADGLEILELTGSSAISGTGNAAENLLIGNKGANRLDGKGGADTMEGNGGNDTYVVDDAGDRLIEIDKGGTDLVLSAVSFDLSLAGREPIENLTLTGDADDDIDAIGNALANTLTGNAGDNLLDGKGGADRMAGGLGDDTYVVDTAKDRVTEGKDAGTDTVQSVFSYVLGANLENLELLAAAGDSAGTGNAANNRLTGNEGNNTLDGRGGDDTMLGGLGDDTYVIDKVGDVADETDGGGTDTLVTPFATALAAGFENLTLSGRTAVAGTGNAADNVLLGNSGANVLDALEGADSVSGGGGNDALTGGAGSDTLDGGTGADKMTGGAGDDLYRVDNAKDVVVEQPDDGTDTVESRITYTLGADLENLILIGTAAVSGTGNVLDNVIVGNTAANVLSGGAGDDVLDGGKGADKLSGGAGSDTFLRHSLAEGKDTITDFETGPGGDLLDISDILIGYVDGVSTAADFVQCVTAGGNTTVKVDADGAANGSKFADVCVLTGVAATLGDLLADGNVALT